MKPKILVLEDDPTLRQTLVDRLESEGYSPLLASNTDEAKTHLTRDIPDLAIFDIMLPGQSGLDFCRDLRSSGIQFPIIFLTAKQQTVDKVIGLKLGADDYVTKPFDSMELMARIEALLRRTQGPKVGQRFMFGPFLVDFSKPEIKKNGKVLSLTALDFKLLQYFLAHPNVTLSREALLNDVWGYDSMLMTRTVDVHIAGLRQKIEDKPSFPQWIVTVHRMGYKFVLPG